ncbi:MAG: hypothetical protein U5R14_10725 [Gemmatimonadota bacterium]|nr:hypothetical protein [Gemmatimonadota bacterium]
MYDKLAGMTGTAETEENEFHQIYNLDVLVIPTNRPVVRDDRDDLIFRTKREKYNAIMEEIERLNKLELARAGRDHERRGLGDDRAHAQAPGHQAPGAQRQAPQVGVGDRAGRGPARRGHDRDEHGRPRHRHQAGRGRDRGQDARLDRGARARARRGVAGRPRAGRRHEDRGRRRRARGGGLQILGSERHDSRRIDRQLRGRAGRQGDPGATQFYLSLEDDLMRLFGSERIANVMDKWGAEEGEVITHGLATKSIERAQKRVEGNNFEQRKRLLDYDDVMNQQREVIYDLRLFALEGGEDLKGEIWEMVEGAGRDAIDEYCPAEAPEEGWDLAGLRNRLVMDFFLVVKQLPEENDPDHEIDRDEVEEWVIGGLRDSFHKKLETLGEHAELVTSFVMLSVIDDKWKDHLYDLDHLKASIGFRGWGQKDPLVEYKKEAYEMFVDLMADLRKTVASYFFRAQFGQQTQERRQPQQQRLAYSGPDDAPSHDAGSRAAQAGRQAGRQQASSPPRHGSRSTSSGWRPARPPVAPAPQGARSAEALHEPRRGSRRSRSP